MLLTSDISTMLRLHKAMFVAREVDRVERDLVKQGLAHFHVSGAGHESTALIADFLGPQDWLHLHYRDKALMLARGLPIVELFRSVLATGPSHSAGRQMSAHLSSRQLNITSIVGPVGNNALHAAGVGAAIKSLPGSPIAICCIGDGTTQQGEVLEAIGETVRTRSPVLFVIENNRYAISTGTAGQTFFDLPSGPASRFWGMEIVRADGADPIATRGAFEATVSAVRQKRGPALLVLDLERLSDHTNADDQSVYRTAGEIAEGRARDPLEAVRTWLRESQMGEFTLAQLEAQLTDEVLNAARQATQDAAPIDGGGAKAPYPSDFTLTAEYTGNGARTLTMREALNRVLRQHLADDPAVHLLGEDIEDPKGDVFGVTRGLSTAFPGRVRNAPLSESTIVGTAIGRALTGQRPVAFLQFADFLPLAFNQIISELGSMHWRTNGDWQAPVIVMVSCGGYKPGLGPFHAQTLESVMAHTPGIDVVMPASAGDAAGLLNAAFASGRPTIFLYPKVTLNLPDRATSDDTARQFVLPGRARVVRPGADLTVVTWGNPLTQSLMAAATLADAGVSAEIIDLRSISPWDEATVLRSVRRTGRLLVVHEDNHTVGFGAEVLATVMEKADTAVLARRVTRDDSYVPFHFGAQIDALPSYRRILEAAADMTGFDLAWETPGLTTGPTPVNAIGSGPADDEVTVIEMSVAVGDFIRAGQMVALVEATKAAVEVQSTVTGTVLEVVGVPGGKVAVGAPLILVEPDAGSVVARAAPVAEIIRKATLTRRQAPSRPAILVERRRAPVIGVSGIAGVTGSRAVPNSALNGQWDRRTTDDIEGVTGIVSRQWVAEGETVQSLAVAAARRLLDAKGLAIADIDLVIAATGTPDIITPSLACRVADMLASPGRASLPAYDINAACSGYLYALTQAHDFIAHRPEARVLVLTSEVLSPLLDPDDFTTAVIFGDAASASLVTGRDTEASPMFTFARPLMGGAPERGDMLRVPRLGDGVIGMNGREVFSDAVRAMTQMLGAACALEGLAVSDLDLLVPHQANQRIIDAIGRRTGRPAHSVIRHLGNTSSSSIPLALIDVLPRRRPGERLGLVAFGGGITYAAAVAEVGDT
jgi:2-oxoisovalerate dehydrogenase E1 component